MKRTSLIVFLLAVSCSKPTSEVTQPEAEKVVAENNQAAPVPAPEKKPLTVESGARVLALDGEVKVDGEAALVGTPIKPTSTIETGEKAWARITLMPHNVIAIRPQTKFTLGKSARKEWSLQLAIGAVWSLLPKGASYEVVTSNAVAGVRGTTLFVTAESEGKSAVCTCDGEVELTGGSKKRVVKSKHTHMGTLIAGSGKKIKLAVQKKTKNPPGHDDVEGAELEKLRESVEH